MIETAIQPTRAAQVTNPAFNAIAKPLGSPEPGLSLALLAAFRLVAWFGQTNASHPQGPRVAFIRRLVDPPIATDFTWRFTKQPTMHFQTGQQFRRIRRIARQDAILADQAAIHFSIPNLVPELGVLRLGFAATNDGGVRLEQTDHFVGGRDGLTAAGALRR